MTKARTLKQVNAALRAAGSNDELVRGDGYYYFAGETAHLFEQSGVYGVCYLNQLSVERWVEEWKDRYQKMVDDAAGEFPIAD